MSELYLFHDGGSGIEREVTVFGPDDNTPERCAAAITAQSRHYRGGVTPGGGFTAIQLPAPQITIVSCEGEPE